MIRNLSAWLVVGVIAGGCGRSEDQATAPAAEGSDDPRPAWAEILKQEPSRTAERLPLFDPGMPGAATADHARATAIVPDALSAEADAVLAQPETFPGASAELRALVAGAEPRAAAAAVLAGASRIEGGAPASPPQLEALRRGPARLALLVALGLGAAGQPMAGARTALAVARMGHDRARGGTLAAAMTARAIERQALAVLRTLAAHPKLTRQDLPLLMTALARLASSRPAIGAAMVAEIDATAARVLDDEQRAGLESGTHPDAALNALLEQRTIALELAQVASKPLPAQLSWFETRSCKVAGAARTCKELARYLVAAALAEAHARATQIALAAALELRGGDKAGEPPLDPVTGKAFERVEADGVKLIRRGSSPLDQEPGVEPRDVPVS